VRITPLREELLFLWGVGPETADSILLYAGGRSSFVIDAYTLRIGRRLGWFNSKTGYTQAQAFMTTHLKKSSKLYAEFHALFVALGKEYCRVKPLCAGCPLLKVCPTGQRRKV
jgi:endonuclease-3 related protein